MNQNELHMSFILNSSGRTTRPTNVKVLQPNCNESIVIAHIYSYVYLQKQRAIAPVACLPYSLLVIHIEQT